MMKSGKASMAALFPLFHTSMYLCAIASGVSTAVAAGGELWDELCDAAGVVAIDWFGGDGFAAAGACSCAFETKQKPADRMMMIAVLSKRIFLPKAAQDTATGAAVAKDAIRYANHPEHRRA